MVDNIASILAGLTPNVPTQGAATENAAQQGAFTSALEAVEQVNQQQQVADGALSALASGESVDLHGTFVELEKADITLRTMVSVRDKVIHAYEQIMNMGI